MLNTFAIQRKGLLGCPLSLHPQHFRRGRREQPGEPERSTVEICAELGTLRSWHGTGCGVARCLFTSGIR
eukprot:7703208-Pyramimonas_sp.AAC.1